MIHREERATRETTAVFQGASNLNLDAKGRLAVPTRHRDALQVQSEGRLTLTRHPHGCLLLFPRPVWEAFRDEVVAWPMDARAWKRIFLGNAVDVEMDGSGRVLISPELRRAASLEKAVMLLGMGTHLEIWDAAAYERQEAETLAQGLPESLANFSF